jgi:hypothetical protein
MRAEPGLVRVLAQIQDASSASALQSTFEEILGQNPVLRRQVLLVERFNGRSCLKRFLAGPFKFAASSKHHLCRTKVEGRDTGRFAEGIVQAIAIVTARGTPSLQNLNFRPVWLLISLFDEEGVQSGCWAWR